MWILKIIFRTVIILAVAGLVCSGIYLWVNNGGSLAGGDGGFMGEGEFGRAGEHFAPDGTRPQFEGRGFPGEGGRPERMGHDVEGGFGLQRGLIDLAGKLGLVAIVTVVVTLIGWVIKRFTRKRQTVPAS